MASVDAELVEKLEAASRQIPRAIIFDPADLWSSLAPGTLKLPRGVESIREHRVHGRYVLLRIARGLRDMAASNLVVALCPSQAFDQAEYRELRDARAPIWFVAPIEEAQLRPHGREDAGFRTLASEIERQFHDSPVLVPSGQTALADQLWELVATRLAAGADAAGFARAVRALRRYSEALVRRGRSLDGLEPLGGMLLDLETGNRVRASVPGFRRRADDIHQCLSRSLAQWRDLAHESKDICARRARGAEFHGDMAEKLLEGLIENLQIIRRRLDKSWDEVAGDDLLAWRRDALLVLARPNAVVPVAGVFSSGKTTFFNQILGRAPDGLPPLRTAHTHNTALLSCFHHSAGPEDRSVELQWRESVDLELLWSDDRDGRPILAPCDGVIEKKEKIGEAWLFQIRPYQGEPAWEFVDATMHQPLPSLVVGSRVRQNQPLTTGTRPEDHNRRLETEESLAVTLRGRTTRAVLQFLNEGYLEDVQFRVTRRVRARLQPFSLVADVLRRPEQQREVIDWLAKHAEAASEHRVLVRDECLTQVHLSGRLRADRKHPDKHPLKTAEDWRWFQGGAPAQGEARSEAPSQGRHIGFAESSVVEYLIERADIHIDSPLFSLVNLVDTPGLNSITVQHDRITEDFVRRGHGFLLFAKLGRAAFHQATVRCLTLMIAALREQKIPVTERAKHIFIVLNWFHKEAGARTEADARKRVSDFRAMATALLSGAQPRIYVVDLSHDALAKPTPDKLLGESSLATLLLDLKQFLAMRGLGARLQQLSDTLEQKTRRWREGRAEERRILSSSTSVEILQRLRGAQDKVAAHGALRRELLAQIEESCGEPLALLDKLDRLLADNETKEDFSEVARSGVRFMEQYNESRNALVEELPRQLSSRIRTAMKQVIPEAPGIRGGAEFVVRVPALSVTSFRAALRTITDNWPSGVKRFFHAIGNFEYYGTTRGQELKREYVEAPRGSATKAIAELKAALSAQVNEACDGMAETVRQRLTDAAASEEQRDRRRRELDAQEKRVNALDYELRGVAELLRKVAADTTGTGERNHGRAR